MRPGTTDYSRWSAVGASASSGEEEEEERPPAPPRAAAAQRTAAAAPPAPPAPPAAAAEDPNANLQHFLELRARRYAEHLAATLRRGARSDATRCLKRVV
jgi:hypothetical protein